VAKLHDEDEYAEKYSGGNRCKFTTSLKTEPEQSVQKSTTKPITESNSDPIHDEAL
jgi:endo-beta-N-acetylglucosaminidase D